MDKKIGKLKNFLDHAHSSYHAVAQLKTLLEEAGYLQLNEGEAWQLQEDGKYYTIRGGNALIAFRVPAGEKKGFLISAAHSDRPCFKLKENGEISGKYTRLSVEKYGGMIMSSWLDRPLSVAGRVFVETQEGVESRLVDIDRDLLLIPSVAIHMNRQVNEGYNWNPAVDLLPLAGGQNATGKLEALLEQTAGEKILGHDLYLYVRQNASVWGVEEAYLSAPALDDLLCAWCCTQGFLTAAKSESVPVLCVFDSEEVGSSSVQGAASTFLEDVLQRICQATGLDKNILLHNSFMVSADNGHALHPNHPELSDSNNAPVMGKGVVIKFNGALRYTTDGESAAVFRKVCAKGKVAVQTYYNRADLPGGSTLGCISLNHVSVLSVDIGVAQLAMHSCYETAAVADAQALTKAMKTYYSSTLVRTGNTTNLL